MIAYGSLQLLEARPLKFGEFQWFLRPHHIAEDFAAWLALVRAAFDGKWSVQTMLCNERGLGLTWSSALATGIFTGCVRRPGPASFAQHCPTPMENVPMELLGLQSVAGNYGYPPNAKPSAG